MSLQTLIKQPSENRLYTMDFYANMAVGETVTAVVSVTASPSGLTITDPATFSGTTASQRISGGASGVSYKVTFVVDTSSGNRLEGEGILQVKDL